MRSLWTLGLVCALSVAYVSYQAWFDGHGLLTFDTVTFAAEQD